jgi:hypothetical protein
LAYVGEEGSLFAAMNSLVASSTERDDVAPDVVPAMRAVEHMMQVQRLGGAASRALIPLERKKAQ